VDFVQGGRELRGALGDLLVEVLDVRADSVLQRAEARGHEVELVGEGARRPQGLERRGEPLGAQLDGEPRELAHRPGQLVAQHRVGEPADRGRQHREPQHDREDAFGEPAVKRRTVGRDLEGADVALAALGVRDGEALRAGAVATRGLAGLEGLAGARLQAHVRDLGRARDLVQLPANGLRLDVPERQGKQRDMGGGDRPDRMVEALVFLAHRECDLHAGGDDGAEHRGADRAPQERARQRPERQAGRRVGRARLHQRRNCPKSKS
jgi:hypothetical protein